MNARATWLRALLVGTLLLLGAGLAFGAGNLVHLQRGVARDGRRPGEGLQGQVPGRQGRRHPGGQRRAHHPHQGRGGQAAGRRHHGGRQGEPRGDRRPAAGLQGEGGRRVPRRGQGSQRPVLRLQLQHPGVHREHRAGETRGDAEELEGPRGQEVERQDRPGQPRALGLLLRAAVPDGRPLRVGSHQRRAQGRDLRAHLHAGLHPRRPRRVRHRGHRRRQRVHREEQGQSGGRRVPERGHGAPVRRFRDHQGRAEPRQREAVDGLPDHEGGHGHHLPGPALPTDGPSRRRRAPGPAAERRDQVLRVRRRGGRRRSGTSTSRSSARSSRPSERECR